MTAGTLFVIVGASGVGKDTLMAGAHAALADDKRYVFARRVITRAADAGGEDHSAVSADEFARLKAAGDFLVDWSAHGLSYGLRAALAEDLAHGRHVVANGSRAAIAAIAERVPRLVVVEITAQPQTAAARLRARGRETGPDIAERIGRVTPPYPAGIPVVRVANDGEAAAGIATLVAVLREAA